MKRYNFDLARKIIDKFQTFTTVETATLGMHEDWFWTAQRIYDASGYIHPLPPNADDAYEELKAKRGTEGILSLADTYKHILVGGLYESHWGTPVLQLETSEGDFTFNCFRSDTPTDPLHRIENMFAWTSGPISEVVRELRDKETLLNFEQ